MFIVLFGLSYQRKPIVSGVKDKNEWTKKVLKFDFIIEF